jgi:hypothetical protein
MEELKWKRCETLLWWNQNAHGVGCGDLSEKAAHTSQTAERVKREK